MKPFLLLAGEECYPRKKREDWRGFYATMEEAETQLDKLREHERWSPIEWWEIVDLRNFLFESPEESCIRDFHDSLRAAVEQAGGAPTAIKLDLNELAKILAPNGIRFHYDKSRSLSVIDKKNEKES